MSDLLSRIQRPALLAALAVGLAACNSGSGSGSGSGLAPGSIANNPGAPDEFTRFVVAQNEGGKSQELVIEDAFWGRLVDVYDLDPLTGESQPLFRDLLVGAGIDSDGTDYLLERIPGLSRERLTILHPLGSPEFQSAFIQLELTLQPIQTKGPTSLPPFPQVPRNGAMVLVFNDLLEDGGDFGDAQWPGSVTVQNVKVAVGYPPQTSFELRLVPDRNHGDIVDGQFHTTRVLLDFTVSDEDSQQVGVPVNFLGLPGAVSTSQPNILIRIPSRENVTVGQFDILRNLTDHGVGISANGPVDLTSPTLDVLRALRSGGKTAVTGDPFNGFLRDVVPPRLMASQSAIVSAIDPVMGDDYLVDFTFVTTDCAMTPRKGDVLKLSDHLMQVTADGSPPVAGVASDVPARLVQGDPQTLIPSLAEFRTAFDPVGGHMPECFLVFSPAAAVPPAEQVPPSASVTVGFDEPMDPSTLLALETFRIIDPTVPASAPLRRQLVGEVLPNQQLTRFSFAPSLPFSHTSGSAETFNVALSGGTKGITDLAGNPVAQLPASVPFTLDPTAPTLITGGVSLRFNSPDEDGNGLAEIRGQFVLNQAAGTLFARPVTRLSATLDSSALAPPTVQMMTPVGAFLEPLSRYGSKLQTVWRYADLGFPLLDDSLLNLDVEGLAWVPAANALLIDNFPGFSIGLGHSQFLPDEYINPGPPPFVQHFASGLVTNFAANVAEPLTVVHPKSSGYLLQPLDTFLTATGTLMAPWPLNRGIPSSQFNLWTFRDTAKTFVGAPNGQGVELGVLINSLPMVPPPVYPADAVPTLGLPLLMEFRTYPSDANAINSLSLAAVNTFGLPFFRAHSTGGFDASNNTVLVQPDLEILAKGGFDASGAPTPPTDNGFIYGQADFVVRVSRIHTIWLDTAGSPSQFAPAVFTPTLQNIPTGTGIALAFRGASAVTNATGTGAATDAANYDPYGNSGLPGAMPFSATFLNGDASWKSDLTLLGGARYIQVRMTLTSNIESSVSPELDAIGIPFFK